MCQTSDIMLMSSFTLCFKSITVYVHLFSFQSLTAANRNKMPIIFRFQCKIKKCNGSSKIYQDINESRVDCFFFSFSRHKIVRMSGFREVMLLTDGLAWIQMDMNIASRSLTVFIKCCCVSRPNASVQAREQQRTSTNTHAYFTAQVRAAHSPHYRISLLIRSSLWSRKCRACSSANFHLYFKADQCCPSAATLSALLTSSF